MRTKTLRAKSRPALTPTRRSLRSSSAAARALPVLLNQDDESHQQSDRTHKIVTESSSDSDCNDDEVGVVPDSVDIIVEKEVDLSAQTENNNSEDSLEEGTCIRCKGRERDDQVLFCSEIGCVIGVHEKCMGCNPWFDDSGRFYCPICRQKQMLACVWETRRRVKDAKKALLSFLEGSKVTGNKGKEKLNRRDQRNEPCKLSSLGDGICHYNENDLNDVEVENQGTVQEEDVRKGIENAELGCIDQGTVMPENEAVQPNSFVVNSGDNVGCREEVPSKANLFEMRGRETLEDEQEEGLGLMGDSEEDERIGKDKEETEAFCTSHVAEVRIEGEEEEDLEPMDVSEYDREAMGALNTSHVAEERNADGAVKVSIKGADTRVSKNNEAMEKDKEQMQPETSNSDRLANASPVSETETLSKPRGRFKRRAGKATRPQNDSPSMRSSPKLKRAFLRRKASAKKNAVSFYEKVTTSKNSRESTKQHTTVNFPEGRRKRLHWTVEEEEMLKEGVNEFSLTTKNIPWRKILEYGRHVFHETRSPMDLKDKWRNMDRDGVRVNR